MQVARRSEALTPQQADAVLTHTVGDPLHPYIVISLLTGARTKEVRALRWDNVRLDPPQGIPAHIEVWRSVRATGDTKTRKSRRTLALSTLAIQALQHQHTQQQQHRRKAWQETGLVFTTSQGTQMDAANVRRDLRRALSKVPSINPHDWTPRELRHSCVSLLSDAGVPLEQISQLVGHRGITVTELVYRHQLRPVIQTAATTMDCIFTHRTQPGSRGNELRRKPVAR